MNSDRNLHNGWLTTKILLKNFCFKILLNLCKKYFDNLCLKRVCGAVWVGRVGSEMKSLGICQHALLLWRCLMPPTWWQLYVGKYSETSLVNSLLFTSAALISAKRISYRKENSRLKQLVCILFYHYCTYITQAPVYRTRELQKIFSLNSCIFW